jgi:hypothetical protein
LIVLWILDTFSGGHQVQRYKSANLVVGEVLFLAQNYREQERLRFAAPFCSNVLAASEGLLSLGANRATGYGWVL